MTTSAYEYSEFTLSTNAISLEKRAYTHFGHAL